MFDRFASHVDSLWEEGRPVSDPGSAAHRPNP